MFEQSEKLIWWSEEWTESDGDDFGRPWVFLMCSSFNASVCVEALPFCQEGYVKAVTSHLRGKLTLTKKVLLSAFLLFLHTGRKTILTRIAGNEGSMFSSFHITLSFTKFIKCVQCAHFTSDTHHREEEKLQFALALLIGWQRCFAASTCSFDLDTAHIHPLMSDEWTSKQTAGGKDTLEHQVGRRSGTWTSKSTA